MTLKENPSPEPRDEDMCFSPIEPEYDRSFWRKHEYLYPFYPLRQTYSASEIADHLGASIELVRAIAKNGYDGEEIPDAELRTVYNESWRKNRTTWYFTGRSLEKFEKIWGRISESYAKVLWEIGASGDEVTAVLQRIKSMSKVNNVQRSAKSLLTRFRKSRKSEVDLDKR